MAQWDDQWTFWLFLWLNVKADNNQAYVVPLPDGEFSGKQWCIGSFTNYILAYSYFDKLLVGLLEATL